MFSDVATPRQATGECVPINRDFGERVGH
jgi:hypothetical protein